MGASTRSVEMDRTAGRIFPQLDFWLWGRVFSRRWPKARRKRSCQKNQEKLPNSLGTSAHPAVQEGISWSRSASGRCRDVALPRSKQVAFLVAHQLAHGIQVGEEALHALVARVVTGWRTGLWPVLFMPLGRYVCRVDAESKDVLLRQALVLQQLPGRMWRALGFAPAKLPRQIFERAADINGSFRFRQQTGEVPAKSLNVVHTVVRFDSTTGSRFSP